MGSNRHTCIQIVLGMFTELGIAVWLAYKLLRFLDKLLAWCIGNITVIMICLGIASIALLGVAAIWYDHKHAADEVD